MHKCQHTRRSCKDTRHCEGYTRRRWKCAICKELFSTIEVQVDLRKGQSAMDALKEQLGTQVDIKELNRAIELLGRIKKGTA
jgi:transcriptional regulator NrdR family protein